MGHHHIVLVPGFLGFTAIGRLEYFRGVRPLLEHHLGDLGIDARLHYVKTPPTASIRHRAARILDMLAAIAHEDDAPIDIIGHSTGGLDARLAIAPTASLPTDKAFHAYERVRSLVTISCPHYGTPLASTIGGAMGRPFLRFLAILSVFALQRGKLPLRIAFKGGYWLSRLDDYVGLNNTVLDQIYADVLHDFTDERQQELIDLIRQVSADQSLIFQLTSAGCDLLNAGTGDPADLRYGSVVTCARPFGAGGFLAHRHNIYAHALHVAYGLSYSTLARGGTECVAPLLEQQARDITRALGRELSPSDNDGVVPSLSQVWGKVLHVAKADHLDVVGHFEPSKHGAPRADFIPSASGFNEARFSTLWRDVARFIGQRERAEDSKDDHAVVH